MSYVVWEWYNGYFLPYTAEVSQGIEQAQLAGKTEIALGELEPGLALYKVLFSTLEQETEYNGKKRGVRRSLVQAQHPFAKGFKWEWNVWRDSWCTFGVAENEELETSLDNGDLHYTLSTLPYSVDFTTMKQKNLQTNYERKVRRIICTKYPTEGGPPPYTVQPQHNPPPPYTPPVQPPAVQPPAAVQPQNRQRPGRVRSPQPSVATPVLPLNIPVQSAAPASQPASSSASSTVSSTASSSVSSSVPLSKMAKLIQDTCKECKCSVPAKQANCPICMSALSGPSGFDTAADLPGFTCLSVTLMDCDHSLHNKCLSAMIGTGTHFQCPECQKIYGVRQGDQPKSGKMRAWVDGSISLAGYENDGAVVVEYSFTSGQSEDRTMYKAIGYPRRAYFPDNMQGNLIVDLLKVAFKRRLVFTIGTSSTSGQENCVVWNDIHHKTSLNRNDAHGYPDPSYLDRVIDELKNKGVTAGALQ